MARRNGATALTCAAFALAVSACDVHVGDQGVSFGIAQGRASDEWTRTYALESGGRFQIDNPNGVIHASAADGDRVEVHATRQVNRAGSDEAARQVLETVSMGEEVATDHVRLMVTRSADAGGNGLRGPRLTIDYEVRIPNGVAVVLSTENGDITIDDLQGSVEVSLTNGRLRGQGLSGPVDASTVNGSIDLSFQALSGDSRVTTVNGAIRLTLPGDLAVTLEAGAVNGAVSIDDTLALAADERSSRRVTGRLNGGGPRLVVQTTNGGIRIVPRTQVPPQ